MLYQSGRPLSTIDDARRGRGDVKDTQSRVVFRDTPTGFVFVGEHRGIVELPRINAWGSAVLS